MQCVQHHVCKHTCFSPFVLLLLSREWQPEEVGLLITSGRDKADALDVSSSPRSVEAPPGIAIEGIVYSSGSVEVT